MTERPRPETVWREMLRGNERFVSGTPRHPRQDVERRGEIATAQAPRAALFGCSDSRLAAEIIFDKGLGDLFVVRNAGQVISESVIGSLEYAVAVLGASLIVVLGHDECGAVRAAIDAEASDAVALPVHIQGIVDQIAPAVQRVRVSAGVTDTADIDPQEVGRQHLRDTVGALLAASELISAEVAAGTLGIVGANYRLLEGRVVPDVAIGQL
ncbi:MAG: carbonic anhydrase [Microcella sp.]|uniref:carbonic anhydrase n=1 Tax=Microcella sp. TaxID=1913979 RepID=UPI0024C597C9|nr:carbonic anhydrase [Microcella sp.]UYN83695.1 MAG: carbonic anhydrase [Microcella sp.]